MANFDVTVVRLEGVFPHTNADLLALGALGGYRIVIQKDKYQAGDLVAYIPEGSVLPEALIEQMGLVGRLAGSAKNRVKAVRLRGELSQGLILEAKPGWVEGQSVMDELGIVKYEPVIPAGMAGEVYVLTHQEMVHFDLENIKAYPDVVSDGEDVVFTEKIHGTFTMIGSVPERLKRDTDGHLNGRSFVSSKGLMHKMLGLKHNEVNLNNLYLRIAKAWNVYEATETLSDEVDAPVLILGETFGQGVQDLTYGFAKPEFRVFSIVINGRFLNSDEIDLIVARFGLQRVPVVYRGPFSQAVLHLHTDGKEIVSGGSSHMREGVVVTPVIERRDEKLGRVALKSVSADYLLRKNATEFN